jgi:hypothetical protein
VKLLCAHCGGYADPYEDEEPRAPRCGLCHDKLSEEDLARGREGPPKRKPRDEVPVPDGVTVREGGNGGPLVVMCKWPRTRGVWTLVVSCLGFGATVYATRGNPNATNADLFAGVLGLGALVFAAYFLLETTQFTLDGPSLTVHHGPLPWPGNRTFDAHAILQLYVTVDTVETRGSDMTFYCLVALLQNGKEVEIDSFQDNRRMALLLENLFEERLALTPARVQGEVESVHVDRGGDPPKGPARIRWGGAARWPRTKSWPRTKIWPSRRQPPQSPTNCRR